MSQQDFVMEEEGEGAIENVMSQVRDVIYRRDEPWDDLPFAVEITPIRVR